MSEENTSEEVVSQTSTENTENTDIDTSTPDNAVQESEGENTETQTAGKFFDQEQVNRIVQDRLARAQQKYQGLDPGLVRRVEELAGLPLDQIATHLEKQKNEERIEQSAEELGVTREYAQKLLETQNRTQSLEQRLTEIQQQQINYAQRAELRNKPFFADYEGKINEITSRYPGVDLATAYNFVLGQNIQDIVSKASTSSEQKAINSIKNQKSKRVEGSGGAVDGDIDIPVEHLELARLYNISPKALARQIKQSK